MGQLIEGAPLLHFDYDPEDVGALYRHHTCAEDEHAGRLADLTVDLMHNVKFWPEYHRYKQWRSFVLAHPDEYNFVKEQLARLKANFQLPDIPPSRLLPPLPVSERLDELVMKTFQTAYGARDMEPRMSTKDPSLPVRSSSMSPASGADSLDG